MTALPSPPRALRLSACSALLGLSLLASACARDDAPADTLPASGTAAVTAAPDAPAPAADAPGVADDAAATGPADAPGPDAPPLAAMLEIRGVSCQRSDSGIQTCTAPGYDISGVDRACTDTGAGYGIVREDRVVLADRYPQQDVAPASVATLVAGQFLCVQFLAESTTGGNGWAYVTAIDPGMVRACLDNPVCGTGGLVPDWAGSVPPGICAVGPEGRYTVGCAAGWLPREAIDEFSMGL